jgi:hypothetical protein
MFSILFILFSTILLIFYVHFYTDRYAAVEYTIPNEQDLGDCWMSIHLFCSPSPIKWKSPRMLFLSTIYNFILPYNRKIGHVTVEFFAANDKEGERPFYFHTGMTDDGKRVSHHLFKEKVGLGMMLQRFKGKMEDTALLQEEVIAKQSSGRVHTLTYKLPIEARERVQIFIKEYRSRGLDQYYSGLQYRLFDQRGAGCFAFAYGFLELLGLESDPSIKKEMKRVRLPKSLIGVPEENYPVSIWTILSDPRSKYWGTNEQDSFTIEFWDLDDLFDRIRDEKIEARPDQIMKHKRSKQLVFDRSKHCIPKHHPFDQ